MDISSRGNYPSNKLSNFAVHPFVLDDIEISSMEGFLQSLKFKEPAMQREVCKLTGMAAKRKGSKKKWQRNGILYWNGKAYDRFSDEYQKLLDRAYNALAKNNGFQRALLATGNATLKHSIGKRKKADTILTVSEFCGRLTKIREQLKGE